MLNAAGMTTGHGRPFDAKAVQWIRHAYHIPAPNPYTDGEISVADTAERLGVSTGVVYDWIKTGKLAARRGSGNRLCIPWTDQRRGRMPLPHHRIRPPQPSSATHQMPQTRRDLAPLSVPSGIILHRRPSQSTQLHHQPEHPNPRLQEAQYETSVPTVADRVAQTVVAARLERKVEPIFHPDSYGYRPERSALDAVARAGGGAGNSDWVIDLDIRKFLDASSHCSFR